MAIDAGGSETLHTWGDLSQGGWCSQDLHLEPPNNCEGLELGVLLKG
jgi:hypothetical protein